MREAKNFGPKNWRAIYGELLSMESRDREAWIDNEGLGFTRVATLAVRWKLAGEIVYELTHSIAALFALTSAPGINWETSPHEAFSIKVPKEFSAPGATDDSWILVGMLNGDIHAWHWKIPGACEDGLGATFSESISGRDLEAAHDFKRDGERLDAAEERIRLLAHRIIANTMAFVTQHRGSVISRQPTRRKQTAMRNGVMVVTTPPGIVVTREFRDAARAAIASESLGGIRRALAHVVRGHWRNQPTGPNRSERKLTWVRPHRRGDESLGSVVSRIEKIVTSH